MGNAMQLAWGPSPGGDGHLAMMGLIRVIAAKLAQVACGLGRGNAKAVPDVTMVGRKWIVLL